MLFEKKGLVKFGHSYKCKKKKILKKFKTKNWADEKCWLSSNMDLVISVVKLSLFLLTQPFF